MIKSALWQYYGRNQNTPRGFFKVVWQEWDSCDLVHWQGHQSYQDLWWWEICWPHGGWWSIALWVFISLSRNIFVFKLIIWLQFSSTIFETFFLHDRQLPKDYANYFFYQIWPIFAEIFAKNMKGSPGNSEILCVNQIDRDLKKSRKQQFYLRTPSRCKYLPNIFCHNIFQKIFGARLTWQDSTRPSTSFAWPL